MEQRKEIVGRYVSLGLTVAQCVSIAGLAKSTYYYKSIGGKKGKRPSGYTIKGSQVVSDSEVVSRMEALLTEDEFIDYGYHTTTKVLKKEGYRINHKKVYRLMREKKLLYPAIKAGRLAKRGFVKYTVPKYEHPFANMEMDIKYLYIHGQQRNGFLLTLIDTFTRIAVGWVLDFTMKSNHVAELLKVVSKDPLVTPYLNKSKVMVRTDNGPQFISKLLEESIKDYPFTREFIHPGIPQENAHIESFHSTLTRLVERKYYFESIHQAREVLNRFYHCYNNKRVMKSTLYCSPMEFLKEWENKKVIIGEKNKKQKFFFRERQLA